MNLDVRALHFHSFQLWCVASPIIVMLADRGVWTIYIMTRGGKRMEVYMDVYYEKRGHIKGIICCIVYCSKMV
jgi:hypothetical protein